MTPQIIYIILSLLGLGIMLEKHGTPKKGNYNIYTSLIASAICWYLLYKGGFFDVFLK